MSTWREGDNILLYIPPDYANHIKPRIAAFELLGGVVHMPTHNPKLWKPVYENTFDRIHYLANEKQYCIMMISNCHHIYGNMSIKEFKEAVESIATHLPPFIAAFSFKRNYTSKPFTNLWKLFIDYFWKQIEPNLKESLYCGPAGGRLSSKDATCLKRTQDISAVDRAYANNLKIRYMSPEELYKGSASETKREFVYSTSPYELTADEKASHLVSPDHAYTIPDFSNNNGKNKQLFIIVYGPPYSGKTYLINQLVKQSTQNSAPYKWIPYVHPPMKDIASIRKDIIEGYSIIIEDNCYKPEDRLYWISCTKGLSIKPHLISMQTPLRLCQHLAYVSMHSKPHPKIEINAIVLALKKYRKEFKPTNLDEVKYANIIDYSPRIIDSVEYQYYYSL